MMSNHVFFLKQGHLLTLPKFNMEPKNDGFQKESPIQGAIVRFHVKLWEGSEDARCVISPSGLYSSSFALVSRIETWFQMEIRSVAAYSRI